MADKRWLYARSGSLTQEYDFLQPLAPSAPYIPGPQTTRTGIAAEAELSSSWAAQAQTQGDTTQAAEFGAGFVADVAVYGIGLMSAQVAAGASVVPAVMKHGAVAEGAQVAAQFVAEAAGPNYSEWIAAAAVGVAFDAQTTAQASLVAGVSVGADMSGTESQIAPTWSAVPSTLPPGTQHYMLQYLNDPQGLASNTRAHVGYVDEQNEGDEISTVSDASYSHATGIMTYGTAQVANVTMIADWTGADPDLADWQTRSGAAGVMYAENFDTQAAVDDNRFNEPNGRYPAWDQTTKITGGGSLRFNILDSDDAISGSWRQYLNPATQQQFTSGPVYIQYATYVPTDMLLYRAQTLLPGSPPQPTSGGWKSMILSLWAQSNPDTYQEIVVQNSECIGFPQAYYRPIGGSYETWYRGADTSSLPAGPDGVPGSSGDLGYQPDLDRGTPNPVTTYAEYRQRYGHQFNYKQPVWPYGYLPDLTPPCPDPYALQSGAGFHENDWTIIEVMLDIGTCDGVAADSSLKIWTAKRGEAPIVIYDRQNFAHCNGTFQYYDGFWLLPFETYRQEFTKPTTYVLYDEVITSTQPIAFPNPGGTPHALT